MSKQTPDGLYDALASTLAALKLLQVALEKADESAPKPKPLAVVAGQGRGSKKPRAKLASVGPGPSGAAA